MRQAVTGMLCLFILSPFIPLCQTQDSASINVTSLQKLSGKYISSLSERSEKISGNLDKQTEKYLQQLQKQEARIQKKLYKIDSVAAKNIFTDGEAKYKHIEDGLRNKSSWLLKSTGEYLPWSDSAGTSLKFLESNPAFGKLSSNATAIKLAISKVHTLEDEFRQAANVKEFIRQRKEYLRQKLANYDLGSELKKYNQQAYYYAQQLNEYKQAWDDPDKLEQKTMDLLNKIPAFRDFMKKNSLLAGLLNIPDNYGTSGVAGLQTRDAVQQLLSGQMSLMGPNGQQQAQDNILDAQSQLTSLRNKFQQTGSGGEMPDFKPNNQKTKTFWERIQYGVNLQTSHSTLYFPTTTDIGLSAGYRLDDKNIIGIGFSSKVGWGSDIKHINITGQGISLRSFMDMKLKKSFYASGGFEYNYQQPFNRFQQITPLSQWQQSGLIGISKMVSLKSKIAKQTKLQLLWDFLSYYQTPRSQPFKFRVGYNF